jgi:hypothetical protein
LFLKRRFWNAKSDLKFGQEVVVLVTPVPEKEDYETLFWLASI